MQVKKDMGNKLASYKALSPVCWKRLSRVAKVNERDINTYTFAGKLNPASEVKLSIL